MSVRLQNLIDTHNHLYAGKLIGADLDLHELSIFYGHCPDAEVYDFHPRYASYKRKIEIIKQREALEPKELTDVTFE